MIARREVYDVPSCFLLALPYLSCYMRLASFDPQLQKVPSPEAAPLAARSVRALCLPDEELIGPFGRCCHVVVVRLGDSIRRKELFRGLQPVFRARGVFRERGTVRGRHRELQHDAGVQLRPLAVPGTHSAKIAYKYTPSMVSVRNHNKLCNGTRLYAQSCFLPSHSHCIEPYGTPSPNPIDIYYYPSGGWDPSPPGRFTLQP